MLQVLSKTGEHVASVKIGPMFTTHMMGAYEDNKAGLLHVDLLKYKNADMYTVYPYVENALGKAFCFSYTLNSSPIGKSILL